MVTALSAANAAIPRICSARLQKERNRMSHGANASKLDGLMCSGLSRRSIHFSDCTVRPGLASGVDFDGNTQPAFPYEHPLPSVDDSIRTGSAPSFLR